MKKILQWLIVSSADPEKVSATIRGVMLTWVALIIFLGQAFHVGISEEWLVTVIQTVSAFMGSLLMVFGLGRKLYYALKSSKTK